MAAVLRLTRDRAWLPVVPIAISWALLFGYQWAFFLSYRGAQPTVFSYYSGVLGDGIFLPALNLSAYSVLRQLGACVRWRRLPLYLGLGLMTTLAAFQVQAGLDLVNWSMPTPFHWSAVGRVHFLVMWGELSYLYLALATAVNTWDRLRADSTAWRSFCAAWLGVALFAASLVADYGR